MNAEDRAAALRRLDEVEDQLLRSTMSLARWDPGAHVWREELDAEQARFREQLGLPPAPGAGATSSRAGWVMLIASCVAIVTVLALLNLG
ncbi:hypothetical protein [Microbacterium testaceum]|uniref:hypothetical protein n=1 Tax=Microbacterium testaceum TaxID=2033 RepID=UPI0012ACAE33|nr:hypothetical protein [Microbacterium testaceum]